MQYKIKRIVRNDGTEIQNDELIGRTLDVDENLLNYGQRLMIPYIKPKHSKTVITSMIKSYEYDGNMIILNCQDCVYYLEQA